MPKRSGLLVLVGLLYLPAFSRYDVGSIVDDARYILGAQSLAQGDYRTLDTPTSAPLTDPLPGYPLFLVPFVQAVQPHWAALKVLSFLLTLASAAMVYALLAPWLSAPLALWTAALYAANPTTVNFSITVMSEPCFLFFVLAIFLLWRKAQTSPSRSLPWLIGALVGWAALIRPQGIVLIPSLAFGAWVTRQWRVSLKIGAMALAIWGAVLARNYLVAHTLTGYVENWANVFRHLPEGTSALSALGLQAWHAMRTLFAATVLPAPYLAPFKLIRPAYGAVVVAIAVIAIYGARRFMREESQRPLRVALVTFCVLYSVVQAAWPVLLPRYFLAILPFVLGFFVVGLFALPLSPRVRHARPVILAFLLVAEVGQTMYAHHYMNTHPKASAALPHAAFEWVRRSTPRDAVLLTPEGPVVYLYTQRHCVYGYGPRNAEEWHAQLAAIGVRYVFYKANAILSMRMETGNPSDAESVWERAHAWMASRPDLFPVMYENAAESATVYGVY